MEVVPEGGSFFYHNLSMILDGHTTLEHNLPIHVLHNDVIQLWKQSNTAYTPTLIVAYGAGGNRRTVLHLQYSADQPGVYDVPGGDHRRPFRRRRGKH